MEQGTGNREHGTRSPSLVAGRWRLEAERVSACRMMGVEWAAPMAGRETTDHDHEHEYDHEGDGTAGAR